MEPLLSPDSERSSLISLPLQGTQDSAWYYIDDDVDTTKHYFVSPIQFELSRSLQINVKENNNEGITALPPFEFDRTPIFDDFVPRVSSYNQTTQSSSLPSTTSLISKMVKHKKSPSADSVTRVSGESLLESSEETKEREREAHRKRERKGKGWSIGVNVKRFTHSKGVKEII
jgi:hypothetical protein